MFVNGPTCSEQKDVHIRNTGVISLGEAQKIAARLKVETGADVIIAL